jgi:hypothetical protein
MSCLLLLLPYVRCDVAADGAAGAWQQGLCSTGELSHEVWQLLLPLLYPSSWMMLNLF